MFIAYINNSFGEKITQIFNISNLKINKKLNELSLASFDLPISDVNAQSSNFKEFNQVSIFKQEETEEKLLFNGIVRGINANLTKIEVDLADNLYIFKRKVLYTDKDYIDISIKNIISEILTEINNRKNTGISLNCEIGELVSKNYKTGKNFLDILKDLAKNGYEFQLENNILTFKESIGEDKSSGADFVEFLFDKNNMGANTITSAKTLTNADNISNAIIVRDSGKQQDNTSIDNIGRIEGYFSSGDKDIIIEERKQSTKEFEITPNLNDFFIVNIGDVVKVLIDTGSDILDYSGNLKVIEKEFHSGDLNKTTIKLSTGKVKSLSIIEKIQEIDTKVNDLEL